MKANPFRQEHCVLIPLLLVVCVWTAEAHKQPVHQYIAREGYSLLLKAYGHDIPQLSAFIGLADPSYAGDSAWQKGFITTGAWREDEEDVVYHYDILPGWNYALTSITHFWAADRGDDDGTMIRLQKDLPPPLPPLIDDIGPFPNAYTKMTAFANGGWVLYYPRTILCQNTANSHFLVITPVLSTGGFGIPVSYSGLTTFYHEMKLAIHSKALSSCLVLDVNDAKTIPLSDVGEIKIEETVRNTIVWEVLGRMCHLLGDMSVPAHAHLDEHGLNPDSYEDYVGGAGDPYKAWSADNSGPALILNDSGMTDPHFLMYVMQQQADHFGSNGPTNGDGNDVIGGNPTQVEVNFLNAINLASLGGVTNTTTSWSTADLNIIRDATIPFAIRATAGLLYWFCKATGIAESLQTGASETTSGLPTTAALEQNYPNPFNPTTHIRYQIAKSRLVRLVVYDILGREVAVLVNGYKGPGRYEVEFDAATLPSGVYFARLEAGTYREMKKMILLR